MPFAERACYGIATAASASVATVAPAPPVTASSRISRWARSTGMIEQRVYQVLR
jgi:hypothetical protein